MITWKNEYGMFFVHILKASLLSSLDNIARPKNRNWIFNDKKKTHAHTFMSQSKHCNICSAIFFGTNYRWRDKHFNIIWLWIIEYNLSCGQVLARNSNEEIIPFWSVFFGCFVLNIKVNLCVSINKTFNCNDLINLLTWTFWLVLLNIQTILKLKWA